MPSNDEHCAVLVREADRDRYLATLFAPAERRDALYALYAFNVEIARVRDLAREPLPGEIRLQWWSEVLAGGRESEAAAHPVAAALRAALAQHALASDRLIALIDARAFDLYDEPMATVADLEAYAAGTQSALFAVAAEMLGVRPAAAELPSRHAGIAYSIAGILHGLARHAARRQLYLPIELLDRHQVSRESVFAMQADNPLRAALAEMRALARRHLAAAQAQLTSAPPEILPALLPAALIGPALRRMDRADYQPFQFAPTSPWRRQWQLWRAARDPRRIA
jgi:phytoene synthase